MSRERLEQLIKELETKVIKVGYFKHSPYPDGTPIAYIAAIQEMGCVKGGIPARPTLHPAMEAGAPSYKNGVARAFRNAMAGADLVTGLNATGEVAAGDVKQAITELRSPPLSKITLLLRQARRNGETVTGRTVGNAARAAGFVPDEGAGAALGVSDKPLVDSGKMLQAVTYSVEDA